MLSCANTDKTPKSEDSTKALLRLFYQTVAQTGYEKKFGYTALPYPKRIDLLSSTLECIEKITIPFNDYKSLLDQAIEYAKLCFVPGRFLQYEKDNSYIIDANPIAETKLVAAQGPDETLEDFINDLFFHDIKQVIALCGTAKRYMGVYADFIDYCMQARTFTTNSASVEVQPQSGAAPRVVATPLGEIIIPQSMMSTKLTIRLGTRVKEVTVNLFPLNDGYGFDLIAGTSHTSAAVEIDAIKERLWHLYTISMQQTTLIHCAAGLGRTGHLILTFELIKHFTRVFASDNPKIIASEIHKVLANMRFSRAALVLEEVQFISAIKNAVNLIIYAIEYGYILNSSLQLHPEAISHIKTRIERLGANPLASTTSTSTPNSSPTQSRLS